MTLHARCDASRFHLRISDHGIGIDAAEMPLLFEPFHRAPGVRDLPGMGLGLTLVRQLLQLAGGQIRIESTPHVGTVVSVSLPLIPAGKETAS